MNLKFIASVSLLFGLSYAGQAQVLHLADALQQAVDNYDGIKIKENIVRATAQNTIYQRQEYLPDFTLSAQQSYGTINAQHGPMYAFGGLGSAATSMPGEKQSWDAAFGSLYFANINWDIFTFGRLKQQVKRATAKETTADRDLLHERFKHQVKVGAAYLNLLASQRIKYVQEQNHYRASIFFEMTKSRAKSGLIAEVDASLAEAEMSNAKSLLIKADDKELELSKQLAVLLDDDFKKYTLESRLSTTIPLLPNGELRTNAADEVHPLLKWQKSRILESQEAKKLMETGKLPTVSAFGVIQGRGSGFDWNYRQDPTAYSGSYLKGIGMDRGNYLLGFSVRWNLTSLFRSTTKTKEQQYYTQGLQHAYQEADKELQAQGMLAKQQVRNAFDNWEETNVQLSAAELAYKQHTALYENGLTTLVDYTQSLYSLNRAEIDFEIAQNNVWQSLLLWAAAQGDIDILLEAIKN